MIPLTIGTGSTEEGAEEVGEELPRRAQEDSYCRGQASRGGQVCPVEYGMVNSDKGDNTIPSLTSPAISWG